MLFGYGLMTLLQIPFLENKGYFPTRETNHGEYVQTTDPFSPTFEILVNKTINYYNVSGLAISIVDGDSIYAKGYGYAHFPNTPITPETIFMAASTAKAFTSAALSFLVDDDVKYPEVGWTTPISQLIPDDFVLEDEYTTLHATIEDALVHRTGMARHDFSYPGGPNQTSREIVRALRYHPMVAPFRTALIYSNIIYITLAHVVEVLSGQFIGDFLSDHVFKPLNMKDTYYRLSDTLNSGKPFAKPHYYRSGTGTFQEMNYVDESGMEGAGGSFSTVLDYAKWSRRECSIPKKPVFPACMLLHSDGR